MLATMLSGTLPCGLERGTGYKHGKWAAERLTAKAQPTSMSLWTWSALLPGTLRVRLEVQRAVAALARGLPGASASSTAALFTTALCQTVRPRDFRASRVHAAPVARQWWHECRRDYARSLYEA